MKRMLEKASNRRSAALVCVVFSATTLVWLGGASPAGAVSHEIVPGYRMGPIHLHMKRVRVHHLYRHHHNTRYNDAADTTIEHYRVGRLTVVYCCGKKTRRVISVATTSAEWFTEKGITVGDSRETLEANYHVVCSDEDFVCLLRESDLHQTSFHLSDDLQFIEGIQVFGTAGL